MANRVLRDWTASEKIDKLSCAAEVFFTRLIMKADDFGRFNAHPKLLAAALFPLKDYTNDYITSMLQECQHCGLFVIYTVEGKEYLEIKDFGQRLRNMRSKFPEPPGLKASQQSADNPPSIVSDLRTIVSESPSIVSNPPPETETETEVESESESETEARNESAPDFEKEIFGDERFMGELRRMFKDVDLKKSWSACKLHFSQMPNPPNVTWIWRQKLQTWAENDQRKIDEQREKIKGRTRQNPSQGNGQQPRKKWDWGAGGA